ncbi:hypothetical protein J8273_2159 [Carpediemonas membranifera]|uniref:Uncharacterized protein n=1 Tax=Carpediemonas membranifera TaxID=201153 RepID=A0A8J6E3V5_9EUKA|nr:hypothetical protein J8273_2159 [Carpediemonas membranifera]|eukprot:KAG9396428.1 hypothetical protein J8273_2159 [Carpediemonas membranifera]
MSSGAKRWDNYNWPPLLKLVHIDHTELSDSTALTGKLLAGLAYAVFAPLIMNVLFCFILIFPYLIDLQIVVQLAGFACSLLALCMIPVWGFANYYFGFRALSAKSMKYCIYYILSQGALTIYYAWMAFGFFFNSNGLLRFFTILASVWLGYSGSMLSIVWALITAVLWLLIVVVETIVWTVFIGVSIFVMIRVFQGSYFGRAARIAGVASKFA